MGAVLCSFSMAREMCEGPPRQWQNANPTLQITEVHLLAPHSRGWRSEKFCSYPQDMLLDLSRPTHVHQIQVSWLASRFTLDLRPLLPFQFSFWLRLLVLGAGGAQVRTPRRT